MSDASRRAVLRRYLDGKLGGSQAALAQRSGLSKGRISQLFKAEEPFGERAAQSLARRCGLPLDFFDRADSRSATKHDPQLLDLDAIPDLTEVPRVRFKLSAGVSGYAVEPESGNGKPIYFRQDWFATHGYRPERLFAVRVAGASMEPTLWDGDLVVINTDSTEPRDGVAFAINYEGELVIKRLRRDAGQWYATSDSADQRRFAPKLCTPDVQLVGEVVYKQSERI